MRKSTNYGLNLPDLADQFNLNHWNENTEKLDFELKNETDSRINNDNKLQSNINNSVSTLRNDLNSINEAIVNLTNSTLKTSLLNFCYPIGSLYWSSKNTNPATLFGGTWAQIKDKFILACGDTYTNGATGGSSTVTLTVNQIPSHTHTGPSHTHSFTPSGSVSSTFQGSNTNTSDMSGNTSSTWNMTGNRNGADCSGRISKAEITSTDGSSWTDHNNTKYTINLSHTHSFTPSGTVTSTFKGTAGTTGASGTGNTGSTGDGQAHNNMPPYVVKYCWERVS